MKTSVANSSLTTYRELIAEVRRLCDQKRTGTIFIASEDGHLVRLVLTKGNVVHLVFDTKHSCYDAIPLIHKIKTGRLQFAEGIVEATPNEQLPNTEELLHTLELFYQLDEEEAIQKKNSSLKSPVVAKVAPKLPLALQPTFNFNEALPKVKKALASYVGPFANLLCDEYIKQHGGFKNAYEVLKMIDALALEIGDTETEKAFKIQIKEEIFQSGII